MKTYKLILNSLALGVSIFCNTMDANCPNSDFINYNSPNIECAENIEIVEVPETWEYLGNFKLSAYCHCEKCCGKNNGITASGTTVTANRTVAVDKRIIPLGSHLKIGNDTYIAEDVGGAIKGNRIDIYFPTHKEALEFGIKYKDVYILK